MTTFSTNLQKDRYTTSFQDAKSVTGVSVPGVLPATRGTWQQTFDACRARGTDSRYSGWEYSASGGPREVNFHLATDNEWFVAAADTPVEWCNTTSGVVAFTGSRDRCQSRFGATDMIGNAAEWTNSLYRLDTGIRETMPALDLGASANAWFKFGVAARVNLPSTTGYVSGWDPLLALPTSTSLNEHEFPRPGAFARALSGVVHPARGGSAEDALSAGPMALSLSHDQYAQPNMVGGRCAIQRPKVVSSSGAYYPEIVGASPGPGYVIALATSGQTAIMPFGGSFYVYDATDPRNPVAHPVQQPAGTGTNNAYGMVIRDSIMLHVRDTGLHAFNVSNPASIMHLNGVSTGASSMYNLDAAKGLAALATNDGVRLYPYDSQRVYSEVGRWTNNGFNRQLLMDGNRVYVMEFRMDTSGLRGPTAFHVLDITNPKAPTRTGYLDDVSLPWVNGIPYVTGAYYYPYWPHYWAINAMVWSPGIVAIAFFGAQGQWGSVEAGISLVDVNDPYNPTIIANIPLSQSHYIAKFGRYLVAGGHYGGMINVLDLANIKNPRRMIQGSTIRADLIPATSKCSQGPTGIGTDPRGYIIAACGEVDNRLVVIDVKGLLE